jgi:hypothetical protein
MAAETELEKMLIRLVGDGSSYKKMLDDAKLQTQQMNKDVGSNIVNMSTHWKQAEGHVEKLSLSMRDTRHAIHLLGATTGAEGISRPAMMGVYAFHLLEKGIKAAGSALGGLGLGMAALTGGLAIAGIAAVVAVWKSASEQAKETRESANKAFESMISGSKPAGEAVSEMKIDILKKSLKETAEGQGFWGSLWSDMMGEVKNPSDKIKLVLQGVRDSMDRVKDTEGGVMLATELVGQAAGKATRELQKQRMELTAGKEEAKKFELFSMLAATGLVGVETAARMAHEASAEYRKELERLEDVKTEKQVQSIRDQTSLLGVSKEKAIALKEQLDYMREHPDAEFEDAFIKTADKVAALTDKYKADEREKMQMKVREIEDGRTLLNMSKTQADVEKLILDYMREHKDATRTQAIEATAPQAAALNAENFDKIVKSLQDDLEKTDFNIMKVGKTAGEAFAIDQIQKYEKEVASLGLEAFAEFVGQVNKGKEAVDRLTGAQLFEKVKTPIEKYADKIKELGDLLKMGAISQETYGRAVMMTRKELFGASQQAERFDAVATGSAEALTRLTEQHERLHDNPLDFNVPGQPTIGVQVTGTAAGSAEANTRIGESIEVQKDIREVLRQMNSKPGINLMPAGIY